MDIIVVKSQNFEYWKNYLIKIMKRQKLRGNRNYFDLVDLMRNNTRCQLLDGPSRMSTNKCRSTTLQRGNGQSKGGRRNKSPFRGSQLKSSTMPSKRLNKRRSERNLPTSLREGPCCSHAAPRLMGGEYPSHRVLSGRASRMAWRNSGYPHLSINRAPSRVTGFMGRGPMEDGRHTGMRNSSLQVQPSVWMYENNVDHHCECSNRRKHPRMHHMMSANRRPSRINYYDELEEPIDITDFEEIDAVDDPRMGPRWRSPRVRRVITRTNIQGRQSMWAQKLKSGLIPVVKTESSIITIHESGSALRSLGQRRPSDVSEMDQFEEDNVSNRRSEEEEPRRRRNEEDEARKRHEESDPRKMRFDEPETKKKRNDDVDSRKSKYCSKHSMLDKPARWVTRVKSSIIPVPSVHKPKRTKHKSKRRKKQNADNHIMNHLNAGLGGSDDFEPHIVQTQCELSCHNAMGASMGMRYSDGCVNQGLGAVMESTVNVSQSSYNNSETSVESVHDVENGSVRHAATQSHFGEHADLTLAELMEMKSLEPAEETEEDDDNENGNENVDDNDNESDENENDNENDNDNENEMFNDNGNDNDTDDDIADVLAIPENPLDNLEPVDDNEVDGEVSEALDDMAVVGVEVVEPDDPPAEADVPHTDEEAGGDGHHNNNSVIEIEITLTSGNDTNSDDDEDEDGASAMVAASASSANSSAHVEVESDD